MSQRQKRMTCIAACRRCLPFVILLIGLASASKADLAGFGSADDWTFARKNAPGLPSLSNDVLTLTSYSVGTGHNQAVSAFQRTKVSIEKFSMTFTYQALKDPNKPLSHGFTIAFHNHLSELDAPGGVLPANPFPAILGEPSTLLGYAGIDDDYLPLISNSFAVAVNLRSNAASPLIEPFVRIWNNGTTNPPGDFPPILSSGDPAPVLTSQHPIDVRLVYDGDTLTTSFQDTVTMTMFTRSFALDIPQLVAMDGVDQTMAWFGFTAATCPDSSNGCGTATQTIRNLTFYTPEPSATLALLGIAATGLGISLFRGRGSRKADKQPS